jgi:hypothetical protein
MYDPALQNQRAQGMPGVLATPAASYANKKAYELKSPQVLPAHRHSLRDGFTASFVISSVSRAFLPPSPAMMRQHRGLLDISVGISGPHDFAVRLSLRSSVAPQASTASRTQRS